MVVGLAVDAADELLSPTEGVTLLANRLLIIDVDVDCVGVEHDAIVVAVTFNVVLLTEVD